MLAIKICFQMVRFQSRVSRTAYPSWRSETLGRITSMVSPFYVNGDFRRNGRSSSDISEEARSSDEDLFARLSLILQKLTRPLECAHPSLDVECGDLRQNPSAYNRLMKAYAQVGKLGEVLRLAREMKESGCNPDVFCYNTVMNALVEANQPFEVEALFRGMIADGVTPNISSFNILVKLYSFCLMDFDAGYKVVAMMLENECCPDLITHSTLITGLCRSGRVEDARSYLCWMLEEKYHLDAYTYTPIVQVYCSERKLEEAKQLIDDMESLGYIPNLVTYNIFIRALCKAGNFEEVEKVLRESCSKCWKPDEFTFNAYMDGLCKHGRVKDAYEMLEMMLQHDIYPSQVTLNILLDCLCHEFRFLDAICLLDRSSELEWYPGVVGYNTVMSRLCKVGKWSVVLKLFVDMIKKGIIHNTTTLNIVIDSLCLVGKVHQAKCLIDNKGFAADVTTYNTMIHWFFHMGNLNEALQMICDMHIEKITPDLITHTIIIHGLCKGKKYMEATEYFLTSLKDEFALDVYISFLNKLLHNARYQEMFFLFDGMIKEIQFLSFDIFYSTISTFCRKGFCHETKIYLLCIVLDKMLSLFPRKKSYDNEFL